MELFIPHNCISCGNTEEAKFVFSGPHVKQLCSVCDSYVKFVSKSTVPDATEVKLRIWAITTDLQEISQAKSRCGFVEGLDGLQNRMMYWRLYLAIRNGRTPQGLKKLI